SPRALWRSPVASTSASATRSSSPATPGGGGRHSGRRRPCSAASSPPGMRARFEFPKYSPAWHERGKLMIPVKYNTRNLLVRWKTTALTAIGFILVVALLVVMLAFVEGLNELAKRSGPAGNVIILRDGATDELFSDIVLDDKVSELWTNHAEIVRAGGKPLASQEVYSIATQELPPPPGDDRPTYRFLQIRGVEEPELAGLVHALKLQPGGRWFSRTGTEVVMGSGIARTLGLRVGDIFTPRPDLSWTVVGILQSRGSPFDSEIWA